MTAVCRTICRSAASPPPSASLMLHQCPCGGIVNGLLDAQINPARKRRLQLRAAQLYR
jgi:hypothetical protein